MQFHLHFQLQLFFRALKAWRQIQKLPLIFFALRNIRCSSSLQSNIFAVFVCVFSRASWWFITKIIYNEENYNIFSRAFIFRCVSDAFGIALNERRYHTPNHVHTMFHFYTIGRRTYNGEVWHGTSCHSLGALVSSHQQQLDLHRSLGPIIISFKIV